MKKRKRERYFEYSNPGYFAIIYDAYNNTHARWAHRGSSEEPAREKWEMVRDLRKGGEWIEDVCRRGILLYLDASCCSSSLTRSSAAARSSARVARSSAMAARSSAMAARSLARAASASFTIFCPC